MTQHRHAEMIKAKADNMELVVFINNYGQWEISDLNKLIELHGMPFFLCLPQHNENGQCLHWLNGGNIQLQDFPTNPFVDYFDQLSSWSPELWWMSEQCNIRIKPKKEKRLIAIHPETSDIFVATSAYIAHDGFQLIEIEVDV